ncbi:alpha/beta fold hydrolase [Roseospirillum parvum]|uniref:AB hydrolase-1 domain-containing protein n=1 Tax=Roseospirillum parvum TaxID=83401 RepID=A0A1G7ZLE5_9PROT|nr:alpha/beta fold hydrolase [Roseospirillum parvum]SDH09504.1 hypothetical protein/polyhydroxyalkanoate synthase [Roseospirillum parvum]
MPPWKPPGTPDPHSLLAAGTDPTLLLNALEHEADRRLVAFLDGVLAYRRRPRPPRPPPAPAVWREGTTTLRAPPAPSDGPVVLIVPSLVNRAYILDLAPQRSFIAHLAASGLRPLLLDWDAPGETERAFTLDDYVSGRLERALGVARQLNGGRAPVLLGYCMGGTLAAGLALTTPQPPAALITLAAPWDFHAAASGGLPPDSLWPLLEPVVQALGELPVDLIQMLFAALDPGLVPAKFRRFAGWAEDDPRAIWFIRLEDWLNDGVALAGPLARQCLEDWYGANQPARNQWTLNGHTVDPTKARCPALIVRSTSDRIVPDASAKALGDTWKEADALPLSAGHIGMMAGSHATTSLYQPLTTWLEHHLPTSGA